MKLLLTSGGITNKTLADSLLKLVGLPAKDINLTFIPTASNVEEGDKTWLAEDYMNLKKMGIGFIDIADISAVPKDIWLPRIKKAKVLLFGGGNEFYLLEWIRKSGLNKILPDLLKTKVYVGISAGSMITGSELSTDLSQKLYTEIVSGYKDCKALGYVDFAILPHLNSPYFKVKKGYLDKFAKDFRKPLYALDDQAAIEVKGDNIKLIGEGKYLKYNFEMKKESKSL